MDILKKLQEEFKLKSFQVENTVKLIDDGNTVPFIARYRKEMTGSLDDQIVRQLYERLFYLRNLEDKKEQVKKLIDEQEKLTDEIALSIDKAETITEIDDIYRPFRPKRRTRATIAKEKGLEPLANIILKQDIETEEAIIDEAKIFLSEENGVNTYEDAINGAKDIIAEIISDDAGYRAFIRKITFNKGIIVSKVSKKEENSVYEMYYDYKELVKNIVGHRILAMNRGEREGFLNIKIEAPDDDIINKLKSKIIKNKNYTEKIISDSIDDSYKRLIAPSIEREIRNSLTEKSEDGAIKVFCKNLKQLLLQPPVKDKIVLAFDPGFKNGCKFALIDGIGKVLETGVVYPTHSEKKVSEAKALLIPMIKKYKVQIIAIGNGTASRETEIFTVDLIKEINQDISYIIVNEAGASIYSASKLAADEFPNFDVALRSAVSIGRRLQDPLAELVKIDPKSIGVGQYQHDMNQKKLGEALGGVVEDCVNSVGVDLNTASASLLSYVSGVTPTIAKNIIAYRDENGKFYNRKQLLDVKKLGPKAFEQCAGFLRISDGEVPLDKTGVHPESYKATSELLKLLGYEISDIQKGSIKNLSSKIIDLKEIANTINVGLPTLNDIIKELEKPGRDPRDEMPKPILRSDILTIEDLKDGMILKGVVRNVIDFGVFVDIGVHQDGLVHISQMTDKFIKHPLEVVSVGDVIDVKVIGIDINKKRISLSMKI